MRTYLRFWDGTCMCEKKYNIQIVFSPCSSSEIAYVALESSYSFIATIIRFSAIDCQAWELVQLEYPTPPAGQTALAHANDYSTPGSFGELTSTPLPEPSVVALLMAAILFVGLTGNRVRKLRVSTHVRNAGPLRS